LSTLSVFSYHGATLLLAILVLVRWFVRESFGGVRFGGPFPLFNLFAENRDKQI